VDHGKITGGPGAPILAVSCNGVTTLFQAAEGALEKMPDLHFDLLDVCTGLNSIAVYYKSVMDKLAIEVMEFDVDGKIDRVIVHYR